MNAPRGRGGVKIKLEGPVFDEARRKGLLREGIREGTKALMPRIEATVKLKTPGTGRYRRSIKSKVYDSGAGLIHSDDPRRLKTWLETGRRRGVKTARKGAYAYQAGRRQANSLKKQGFYEDHIVRRLNGR